MKKSVEILGLPIISITEGRELGMSKTLLIDAKKGTVAAITIEDEDWYRGVKLIPYESVIAIGDDAITVTSSENILKLADASDYETLLDENIRVIGTKAITRSGTIQGNITELFIGDDGKIEKCEVTSPDGTSSEVTSDQISIFGKQVTVIDPNGEKKNKPVKPAAVASAQTPTAATAATAAPAPAGSAALKAEPQKEVPKAAPAPAAAPAVEGKPEPQKETAPATPAQAPAATSAAPAPAVSAALKAEPQKEAPKAAPAPAAAPAPTASAIDAAKQAAADKAAEERHRRFLLGKKATRDIKMDNGIVIVQAGQDITEEVLQKAKLANKFIDLSMNVR